MSAVIDFAEAIEAAGYSEEDRALTVQVKWPNDQPLRVHGERPYGA